MRFGGAVVGDVSPVRENRVPLIRISFPSWVYGGRGLVVHMLSASHRYSENRVSHLGYTYLCYWHLYTGLAVGCDLALAAGGVIPPLSPSLSLPLPLSECETWSRVHSADGQ